MQNDQLVPMRFEDGPATNFTARFCTRATAVWGQCAMAYCANGAMEMGGGSRRAGGPDRPSQWVESRDGILIAGRFSTVVFAKTELAPLQFSRQRPLS